MAPQPAQAQDAAADLAAVRLLAKSDARAAVGCYLRDVAHDIETEKLLPLAATMVERIEDLFDTLPGTLYQSENIPGRPPLNSAEIDAYALTYKEGADGALTEATAFWKRRAAEDVELADQVTRPGRS